MLCHILKNSEYFIISLEHFPCEVFFKTGTAFSYQSLLWNQLGVGIYSLDWISWPQTIP